MSTINIGLLRESKVPTDLRVVLSPCQCHEIIKAYPGVQIIVQPSALRCFTDAEYSEAGIPVQEDLSVCDLLLGVKEVKKETLIAEKSYMFFSHTIKKQPANAALLKSILDKRIRLMDFELIKNESGKRLIGFGRFAGIVGCYNGFRLFGLTSERYDLPAAHSCRNRVELDAHLKSVSLPRGFKVVMTGFGRVGNGALEILQTLGLRQVTPNLFLSQNFDEPVFAHIDTSECFVRLTDGGFDKKEFYNSPERYGSVFPAYCHRADLYIACHFWKSGSPGYFTARDTTHPDWHVRTVADVSCDVGGPVGTTIRSSTIDLPFFAFSPATGEETALGTPGSIAVMAVDNLPCELPRDASEDFGSQFIEFVLPEVLTRDPKGRLHRATETGSDGRLMTDFAYLADYARGA